MNALERLLACAGTWRGKNRLHDPTTGQPEDSVATAVVTPAADKRFARVDYTWSYQGKPQEGSLLIGAEPDTGAHTAHWIDTWHMGHKVMAQQGAADDDGGIDVRGSYAAPPGPDWGWRTVIRADGRGLFVRMLNVTPDGDEHPAVEAEYHRD